MREFYADYNNISSINKLEGSKFLDNYAFLSLRYNKIKSVSKKIDDYHKCKYDNIHTLGYHGILNITCLAANLHIERTQ